MQAKQILVIGSGPGGSAIAALLAHGGHKVTLLEKNTFIGGKCSSLDQDGYMVDTGVHMFGRGPNGPFGQVAAILGESLSWCIPDARLDLHLAAHGSRVHLTKSRKGLPSVLNSLVRGWIAPSPFKTIFKAYKGGHANELRVLQRMFLDKDTHYLTALEDVSVKAFFTALSDAPDFLRFVHTMTMLLLVLPWERASAADFLYALFSAVHEGGFGYPLGGAAQIPRTFLRTFPRNGGTIRTATEAARIEVEAGRVKGVTTTAGEFIPAGIVISNAGIRQTLDLAGTQNFPAEYVERMQALKMSEAFIATKYFLKRRLTGMQAPCLLYVPRTAPDHLFDYLADGSLPKDPYLFITVPSLADARLAPLGTELLIAGIPAPCDLARTAQCEALLDLAESVVEHQLFPGLQDAIIAKQRTHIRQTAHITGRATGECIGLAQETGQTGSKKPRPRTPVTGLYLVGSDAGGKGIGTECAVDSALYLYNLLR